MVPLPCAGVTSLIKLFKWLLASLFPPNCSVPSNLWKSWPVIVGQRPFAIENFMWLLERAMWRAVLCVSAKNLFWWGRIVNFILAIVMPDLLWLLQSHWGFCFTLPTFGRSESLKQDWPCQHGVSADVQHCTRMPSGKCHYTPSALMGTKDQCERLIPWELAWLYHSESPTGMSLCWDTLPLQV